MAAWFVRPQPVLEPPENRIGLSFLAVGYGVVLGAVFEPVLKNYTLIQGPGWSQLALAVAAIVLSWIGLFNNRATYPNWRASFVNTPLIQFLLSVAILVGYWALVATAEGIPGAPNEGSKPSFVPEALLIAAIFASYLAWDVLEYSVLFSQRYRTTLAKQDPALHAHIDALTRRAARFLAVTLGFAVFVGVVFWIAWRGNHARPAGTVEWVDVAGIVVLFAYRVIQEQCARDDPSAKATPTAGGWSTLASGDALSSIAQQAGRGEIVGSYVDANGVRQGFVLPP